MNNNEEWRRRRIMVWFIKTYRHQRRPHHRLNPNLVGTKFAMEEIKNKTQKKV
jgi:hypothetical protein